MALDPPLREPDTTKSVSALQALKHLCSRPAKDEKTLAVSLRSVVLGGLVRGRAKRAESDPKASRNTKALVPRDEKAKHQSTEATLDDPPATPPPSEDVTAESSPRDTAVDSGNLCLDVQDQEQRMAGEVLPPMRRRVSFNEVVKEVLIENRHTAYGNKASRRQHFYSRAELAIFKRAWYWHVKAASSHWPVDRLLRCGCPACDKDEGRVPVENDFEEEYSKWTWEG